MRGGTIRNGFGTKFRRGTMKKNQEGPEEDQGPGRPPAGRKNDERPPETCTFAVIPAEDLHLVPLMDVENLTCVFCDGHVGGA